MTAAAISTLPASTALGGIMVPTVVRHNCVQMTLNAFLQSMRARAARNDWKLIISEDQHAFAQHTANLTCSESLSREAVCVARDVAPDAIQILQWSGAECALGPYVLDCGQLAQPVIHRVSLIALEEFIWVVDHNIASRLAAVEYVAWHTEWAGHLQAGVLLPPPPQHLLTPTQTQTNGQLATYCANVDYGKLHVGRFLSVIAAEGKLQPRQKVEPESVIRSNLVDSTRCPKCGAPASEDQMHTRGMDEGPNTSIRCRNPLCRHVETLDSR